MELDTTNGAWYVLQAMSSQEEKALAAMLAKRDYDLQQDIDDGIGDVRVPMDKKEERDSKTNKTIVRMRKRYPGYVLAQLRLVNEEGKIRSEVWDLVKSIPGIIGFVGGSFPEPLSDHDVTEMLRIEEETANTKPKPKVEFQIGDSVRLVGSTAFIGYEGVVESIDNEHQRLKVSVNIFGRSTPTDVDFNDVERILPEDQQQ